MEADLAEFLDRAEPQGADATTTSWTRRSARVVRQVAMEEIGKKPEVTVVISRLVAE